MNYLQLDGKLVHILPWPLTIVNERKPTFL